MSPRGRFALATLAALALAALAPPPASGYGLINPPRRWFPSDLPRNLYVDPRGRASVNDPDHGVTAVLARLDGWEDAQGVGDLIRPVKGTPADPEGIPPYSGGDGISVLRFDDPAGICKGSCLAATTTGGVDIFQYGSCNGMDWYRYTDSDVAFNVNWTYTTETETDAEGGCAGEYYLEAVSVHEVGHLLGLAHTNVTSAVMYAYANACERYKCRIQPDDANGIRKPYACAFSQVSAYADSDQDGYGQDVDCDDQDPSEHPGGWEVCDRRDNDCDGTGDSGEGLSCAEACLDASAGSSALLVTRGACPTRLPGFRYVYARGGLGSLRPSGVTAVEVVSCPTYWIYDRLSESSPRALGDPGVYYLVRADMDATYGSASDGTPRAPIETGCP